MGHPWYAFYPRDYRDKTGGLTMLQDGAYRRLMDEYYITGEPLEANASVLFRVCCAFDEAEQAAVLFVLEKFFVQGDDGWHHLRIDEEIVRRAGISAKRVNAGKLGGKAKNKPKTANARANGKQMPQHLPPHTHTQSISSLRSDNTPASLPDWLDREAWTAFLEMRRRKRAPVTDRAIQILIDKLDGWRAKGHDPTAILDASTSSAWTNLYEPKDENNGNRISKSGASTDQHLSGIVDLRNDLRAAAYRRGSGG